MKTWVILSFILAIGAYASADRTGACYEDYEEEENSICPNNFTNDAAVSSNFSTFEDVIWLFTPKQFYLSYADKYQYARVYEAVNGICAANEADLANMGFQVNFTLFDMALSFSNGHVLHMICIPHKIRANAVLNITFNALKSLQGDKLNKGIESLVNLGITLGITLYPKDFAQFKCEPAPIQPGLSSSADPSMLSNCLVSLSWTDHPADNLLGGTGMLMSKCLNGVPLWGVVSTTQKQPQQNIDAFKSIINSQNFNPSYFYSQSFAN